jgi:hypothetical protein
LISTIKNFRDEYYLFGGYPFVALTIGLVLEHKIKEIKSKLVYLPKQLEQLEVMVDVDQQSAIDPVFQKSCRQFPQFLRFETFGSETQSATRTKQERLFWADSPQFMRRILHVVMISSVIWFVIFYGVYLQFLFREGAWRMYLYSAVVLFVWCFVIFGVCPDVLQELNIVSNVRICTIFLWLDIDDAESARGERGGREIEDGGVGGVCEAVSAVEIGAKGAD